MHGKVARGYGNIARGYNETMQLLLYHYEFKKQVQKNSRVGQGKEL